MTKRLKYTKNVLVTMIKSETENMPKLFQNNNNNINNIFNPNNNNNNNNDINCKNKYFY